MTIQTVLSPPEGYVQNFDHPERTGVPAAYFIGAFGTAISMTFFVQRIYVKLALTSGLQLDDALLILAAIFVLTTSGFSLHMFGSGIGGVHAWEITIPQYNMYMLDVYIAAATYVLCGSFAKLSLLVFYLRLSPQRNFRILTITSIAFISCYTIGTFCAILFGCQPMHKSWDIGVTEGNCVNLPAVYISIATVNIFTDVVLFVLPLPMVVNLHIPKRQKIGLVIIFGIGSITVITSIIRLALLPNLLKNPDGPWTVGVLTIWTLVEGNLIIVCASLPTLRKFFKHVAPKILGESSYGSNARSGGQHSHPPGSRTFVPTSQSKRSRHQYSQFDPEECITTDTYVMGPVSGGKRGKGGAANSDEALGWGDSDSEKAIVAVSDNAILQTRTVTVDVEMADPGPAEHH